MAISLNYTYYNATISSAMADIHLIVSSPFSDRPLSFRVMSHLGTTIINPVKNTSSTTVLFPRLVRSCLFTHCVLFVWRFSTFNYKLCFVFLLLQNIIFIKSKTKNAGGCVVDAHHFLHISCTVSQLNGEETGETLSAYCFSPETVFGAAYLAILPSHRLLHGSSSVRAALEKAHQPGRGELNLLWLQPVGVPNKCTDAVAHTVSVS